MTVYVTFKCDGMMPPGSAERCRAGFSAEADDDDYSTAMEKAWTAALELGWTDEVCGSVDYCPSCTRHRTEVDQ